MDAEREKSPNQKGYYLLCTPKRWKGWTANNYQTVNTQINLLAGVIDGASAFGQYHMVIVIAAAVPYILSHAANPEMILILGCQSLNLGRLWLHTFQPNQSLMQGKT